MDATQNAPRTPPARPPRTICPGAPPRGDKIEEKKSAKVRTEAYGSVNTFLFPESPSMNNF